MSERYPTDGSIHIEDFDPASNAPIDLMVTALLTAKPKGIGYMLLVVTPIQDNEKEVQFDIASNLTTEQMLLAMEQHGKRLKAVN